MTVIERVKEFLKTHHSRLAGGEWEVPEAELLVLLDALAAERCVWNVEKTDDVEFLRPSCRESQCYVEFRSKAEWFKGCPFCLKQIEVKEADNG